MKFYISIFAVTVFVTGCSSDDDPAAISDPGIPADDGMLPDDETPPTPAVLNRDNYIGIVAQVLGIYASQPMRDSLYEPLNVLEDQVADSSSFDQDTFVISSEYACSNGGNANTQVLDGSAMGYRSVVYEQCQFGDSVYDGEVEFSRSEGQSTKRSFRNYSIEDGTAMTVVQINGVVDQTNYICRSDDYKSWSTTDLNWSSTNSNDEQTTIGSSTARFGAGTDCGDPWEANMSGGFTVSSPITGNTTIAVSISPDLLSTQIDNTNFQSGTMRLVSSSDESVLVFNADNGDPDSVSITLETPAGMETFDEPWVTWQGILIPTGTGR